MPDKKYYREKLMNNIKAIQKYCPDFTMTEQQIDEILSDDRIRMHEKMQTFESPLEGKRSESKREITEKFVSISGLKYFYAGAFGRNYFHVAREEKTQEDIEYNKRIFTNLTRDDELGETARTNYVVECMNSVFKLDLNKFKPGTSFEELLNYAVENSDIGGIVMENEHMLSQLNYQLGFKDKNRAHDACQFGNSAGGYMRDLPLFVKDETFLTFPIEYLNGEQYNIISGSLGHESDPKLIAETGISNLPFIIALEKNRRDLPADLEKFEKDFENEKLFTADNIEFKVADKNKRLGGGYFARRNTALEGIDYFLNIDYPIQSEKIENMKAALVNAKTLLMEEKYLNDENALESAVKEFTKASKAVYEFRKLPGISNELADKATTEIGTFGFLANLANMKEQIRYYKEDKEHLVRPNELLQELNEMMAPFNTINEFGEKETLTSGDIYEFRTKMTEVLQATQSLADDPASSGNIREMASSIRDKVGKQLKAMNRAVPGMTLDTALSSRGRKMDMTDHKFKTVGNVLSSRMMMTITGEDGSRQKGFFTKRSGFDLEKDKNELKEKLRAKYPEDIELVNSTVDFYYTSPGNSAKDRFYEEHLNLSKNADAILEECNKIASDYFAAKGETLGMILNLDDKARIDSRNVAMSDVATLIGAEDVIAKSTPMILYDNGVEVEGTFMETAKGEDIDHLHKRSPFMKVKADCLDYSPALRQLADMQVLDYICGNMDRHAGNLFYQFDENGKIIGVTGIDNDASFARGTQLTNQNFTSIEAMKAISKSMAERLNNVTPEMLRASIAGNELVEEDIESAVDRLNLLKNAISEGKVQIMDDAEFANHKLDDFLVGNKVNTYNMIKKKLKKVIEMEPKERKAIEENQDKEARKEEVLDLFETMDKTQLVQDIEPVDAKIQQLEDAGQYVHFGSTEFNNAKNSLKRVNDANRLVSENGRLASKKNYELIQAAYEKVVRDCLSYLAKKEKQGKTKNGVLQVEETSKTGKRIMAIKSVLEFCNNKIQSLEESINPYHIDKEAAKAKKTKNQILASGMVEGLNPKLAGDIIKEMNALSSNENATAKEQIFAAQQIRTVSKYIKENNIELVDCGLNKQDLENAQKTVKVGRVAYANEYPKALQQEQDEITAPQNNGGMIMH